MIERNFILGFYMNRKFVFGGEEYTVVSEKQILIGMEYYYVLFNSRHVKLYLICLPEEK